MWMSLKTSAPKPKSTLPKQHLLGDGLIAGRAAYRTALPRYDPDGVALLEASRTLHAGDLRGTSRSVEDM